MGSQRVPYSEVEGEDGDAMAGGIIGQVSGPRSWSEYETRERGDGPDENFDRRNTTAFPSNIPDPCGRFAGPSR